jgi:ribosomal protein S18 acetylase RimI-like enzyme
MKILPIDSLNQDVILKILTDADEDFYPPLSKKVDLNTWAVKLSKNANFILVQNDNKTLGCLAYYLNKDNRYVFIPFLWVRRTIQSAGWGSRLINHLLEIVFIDYEEIRLEVVKNNVKAILFYEKNGFSIIEDGESKFLLAKHLS